MEINTILTSVAESITFESVIKFLILYFFVIWIAILTWVIKDISARTHNVFYQVFSVLTILILTPFGVFIYLLIRPGKTLYEKYYDEIEDNLDLFHEIIEERKKELEEKTKKKEIKKEVKKAVKKTTKKEEKLEIINEHKKEDKKKKED